jgi:hypothetical protein
MLLKPVACHFVYLTLTYDHALSSCPNEVLKNSLGDRNHALVMNGYAQASHVMALDPCYRICAVHCTENLSTHCSWTVLGYRHQW